MILWLAWLNLVGLPYRSLQFRGHSTLNVRETTNMVQYSKCTDQWKQCYLFWYDNRKGWKILFTTTVNRVDSVGWKYLRRFYLARLRGCAKVQQQNQNWGRAWLVNVKSSTPRKTEALFSYRGQFFLHSCLFRSHHERHKQQLWWHRWLGNINRMKMSLKRNSFILYLRRNLTQKVLRCGILIWAALSPACDSPCCRLHPDTQNSMGQHLHALLSVYEVPLFELRTKANTYFLSF